MRSKLLKLFCASVVGSFIAASVYAAPTVSPVLPQVSVTGSSGSASVYYASTLLPATYYLAPGYSDVDFTSPTTNLQFTVSGVSGNLMLFAENTAGNIAYPVPLYTCNSALCGGGIYYIGAGGGTVTVGINPLSSLCQTTDGANIKGCTAGGAVDQASTPIPGFRIRFVDTTATDPTAVTSATRLAGTALDLFPEIAGPKITGCPGSPGFFPGDGAIIVETHAFTVTAADSANGSSSPSFSTVKMVAQKTALPADYSTAAIIQNAAIGSGEVELLGFENSTSESGGIFYQVDYGIQDSAGVLSFCGQNPGGANQPGYPLSNVFATNIQGFLRESNCFVATASFRNGRAPAVMLLRKFRDEVLVRSEAGRDFIGWYYANGPIAADWLIENPVFRTFALAALIPLEAFAWVALHPSVLWIPFGFLCLLILGLFLRASGSLRRRLLPGLFLVLVSIIGSNSARAAEGAPGASNQPYIDSLISELPRESYAPSAGNPDPYVQKIKRGLAPDETGAGYTEEVKKQIPTDTSPGYTKRIQKGLAPDKGSAIEDYRKGKQLRANKGDLTTSSAFGFQIAATANRTFTAGANQDIAYESVYGSGWIPDFKIHYETRPFPRNWFLSKFGLYGSAGTSFSKANGVFDFDNGGQFGARSRTEFKFIMIPVNVGLIYRMNWGILWPYFGAGPSAIGFIEQRNDNKSSHRGYDFGYWAMGGVALGLDWISPKSSWEQYETMAIKHSYFTIEYSYLTSLSSGLVDMTVDGIQVGFTFEL